MEDLHNSLKSLQATLQNLLKKHAALKAENSQLKNTIEQLNGLLQEKDQLVLTSEEKLTTSGLAAIYNDEEKALLQNKIDSYIKEIDKCLTLLNN
jgi:hypothetical protein